MKTADKVLDRIGISARFIGKDKAELSKALIKEYAISIAIECLQEAVSKLDENDFLSQESFMKTQMRILSTPINTP